MGYSLGQAAKAAGRSKTTIHRAIASGRLSASRTDHGDYSIDPSELARVFQADRSGNSHLERHETGNGIDPVAVERDLYRELAEERLETIRDLRQRLDLEAAERRQLSERLTAILTDQRGKGTGEADRLGENGGDAETALSSNGGAAISTKPALPELPESERPAEPTFGRVPSLMPSSKPSVNLQKVELVIPRPPWWRRWFR